MSTRPLRPPRPMRRLVGTGVLAVLAAAVVTTLVAALAQAAGVEFEVPDGGEAIPLSGIAFITGVLSLVGVVLAAALLRWSARPAERFMWTTVALTAVSLVPPWLVGAAVATSVALVVLHIVAAAVMIPSLSRSLRLPPPSPAESRMASHPERSVPHG